MAGRASVVALTLVALAPVHGLARLAAAVAVGYITASLPLAASLGLILMESIGEAAQLLGVSVANFNYVGAAAPVAAALFSMARYSAGPGYRLEGFALPAAALGALLGGHDSCIDLARPLLAVLAARGLPGPLQLAAAVGGYSWHGLAALSAVAAITPFHVKAPLPARRCLVGIPGRWPAAVECLGPILGGNGAACAIAEPTRGSRLIVVVDHHEPWRIVKCLGLKPDVVICPSCQWEEWSKLTGLPLAREEAAGKGIVFFEGVFPADLALASPPPRGAEVVVVDLTSSPPPAGGWRQTLSYVLRLDAPIVVIAQTGAPREIPSVGGRIPVTVRVERSMRAPAGQAPLLTVIDYGTAKLILPCP
ncbi:hypothetical protein [Stetteria hydrogenophila]